MSSTVSQVPGMGLHKRSMDNVSTNEEMQGVNLVKEGLATSLIHVHVHNNLLIIDSSLDNSLLPLTTFIPTHPHTTHLTISETEINQSRILKKIKQAHIMYYMTKGTYNVEIF